MEETATSVFDALLTTMKNAGFGYMSDERCCEILALVYHFGSESMVLNPIFYRVVVYAQDRLNIFGGEAVHVELASMLQSKIKELEAEKLPEWANEVADKYNVVLAI